MSPTFATSAETREAIDSAQAALARVRSITSGGVTLTGLEAAKSYLNGCIAEAQKARAGVSAQLAEIKGERRLKVVA